MTEPPAEGTAPATPAPRVLVGRYQIGELIGRGGMAEVHAGWDTRLGRPVAIKVLRSDLARDPSFLQRFRREAQAAAGLNHPSIVAVYDSGEDSATELGGAPIAVPFIVMELVEGKTLRELLHATGGPLPPREACRVMAETLRALSYSHANGLIHRDIKPANVMVTDDGEVKLTDFGIARAIADSAATLTNTAVVVGTAQYLSPEQAQGKAIDARADVYAAGCVLYELLTGRPPFSGDSPLAIAYQHVGETPEPPSVHVAELPREIDAVVLRSLRKDPEERYASAGEFAADLEAVQVGHRPSQAALDTLPVPPPYAAQGTDEGGEPTDAPPAPPAKEDGSTSAFPTVTDPAVAARLRLQRRLAAVVAALALVVVTVVGVLAAQGKIGDVGGVTVPDVRSKTLKDAQDQLSALGLAADIRPVPNRQPQDIVVRQSPEGGQQAAAGSRVRLDVSTGPDNVPLPELYNYDQATAASMLRDKGLDVQFEQVESAEIAAGRVVATDPKAGTTVKEGSMVKVLVSNGRVRVPDLRGKTESQAREALMKLTLTMSKSEVDSGGAPGTVVKMDYLGQEVRQGTEIKVSVVRIAPVPIPTQTVTVTAPPPPAPTPTSTPRPSSPTTVTPTSPPQG